MPDEGAEEQLAGALGTAPTGGEILRDTARYRELFRTAPFGIALVALDGRLLDVNPAATKIHGFPRDQIVGHALARLELLFEEDVPQLRSVFRRVAAGEDLPAFEARLRHREGGTRWLEATVVRLERDGAPWAVQVLFQDISPRKEVELALRGSLERYRVLMESAADGILLLRSNGTIIESNVSAAEILGVPPDELEGRRLAEMLAPEDLALHPVPIEGLREGETIRTERVLRHKGGRRLFVEMVLKMVEDGRVMAVVRDVTERRAAERALEQSERRLRTAIHGAPLVLFATDDDGVFTFSEGRGLEKLGLLPGEVVGRSVFNVYKDAPEVCDAVRHALAGEPVHQIASVGGHDWEVRYAPIRDSARVITGVTGVAIDITERRRAERALRRSEARYRALAEYSAVGIWQITPEGHTVYANPAMVRLLELPSLADLAHDTYHRFFTAEGLEVIQREQSRREGGATTSYEVRLRTARGRIREVVVSGAPILDAQGLPQSLIGTFVDVTDRKRAEAERRRLEEHVNQAQKLESLGILAGGIAHDFNNLLTGVLGNAGLAMARLDPDHKATPIVQRIEQAARYAADLTQQLLAYAGRGKVMVQRIDFARLTRDMVNILDTTAARDVTLELDLPDDLPPIEADQAQMRQLILNLVKNAAEASEGPAGHVRLKVGTTDIEASWPDSEWLGEPLRTARYLRLEVADNGCGMDEETRQYVFDPFFTTKPHGRGLGLAAVLGIIRGHGGAIRLDSRPGGGTTFDVLLPIAPIPEEESMTADPQDATDHATILVVEDEVSIREVASLVLEGAGYEVIEAADGESALQAVEGRIGEVGLVILDVTLFGMDSAETLSRLLAQRADLPVLLISGMPQTEAMSGFVAKGLDPKHFLPKPFSAADLEGAVAGILGK